MLLASNISSINRKRKWRIFFEKLSPTQETRILDVEFSEKEFSHLDNYIEKNFPYPDKLTALGIDFPVSFKKKYPKVKCVLYDGDTFPFLDKAFDICWSNAVIEHVGNLEKQLFFLQEIKRVSKKSFITTPNRYFPIEIHTFTPFFHYLPKALFDRYLLFVSKEWAAGDNLNLLSKNQIKRLLKSARVKDYTILKNKIAGITLDFAVILE